jgi:hypothetical protein
MTPIASFAAPTPSHRGVSSETVDVMFVCIAAFLLGLVLDGWFGLLPALAARCGGFKSFQGTLEWHWGVHAGELAHDALRRAFVDRPQGLHDGRTIRARAT